MSLYLFHKSALALLGAGFLESPRRWLADGLLKDKVGCLGFKAQCVKGEIHCYCSLAPKFSSLTMNPLCHRVRVRAVPESTGSRDGVLLGRGRRALEQ